MAAIVQRAAGKDGGRVIGFVSEIDSLPVAGRWRYRIRGEYDRFELGPLRADRPEVRRTADQIAGEEPRAGIEPDFHSRFYGEDGRSIRGEAANDHVADNDVRAIDLGPRRIRRDRARDGGGRSHSRE